MNVLSLFDGLSGARLALQSAGITPTNYFASEVDPSAIRVSSSNFPDIKHLGDVSKVQTDSLPQIDLLIGGSPCTNLAICGDRTGLAGLQSKLFYEYIRILNELKPKHFFLENVASMSAENRDKITELVGVEPVLVNSSILTGQNRKRLYWFNWDAAPMVPTNQTFSDILDIEFVAERFAHSEKAINYMNSKIADGRTHWDFGYHADTAKDKTPCLIANLYKGVPFNVVIDRRFPEPLIRKYTPRECQRLQGVPDDYTGMVSNTQQYKMLGNGFTIPVIAHFLKELK